MAIRGRTWRQYGHPSEHGFKDVIHAWQGREAGNPSELVRSLQAGRGGDTFFAMANHHDNLDLWDSKHQRVELA
jgi:alpha-L-fucosidase